jgi:hypothetical protein
MIRLRPATRTAREILTLRPRLAVMVAVAMCPCREPILSSTRFFRAARLETVTLTS